MKYGRMHPFYNLKTSINHPAIENGYVSTERLLTLLDLDLNRAVEKIHKFKGSKGETFKLGYKSSVEGNVTRFTIEAIDESNDKNKYNGIIFGFCPEFKFSNISNIYVTISSKNCFIPLYLDAVEDRQFIKNFFDFQNIVFHMKIKNVLKAHLTCRWLNGFNWLQVRQKSRNLTILPT